MKLRGQIHQAHRAAARELVVYAESPWPLNRKERRDWLRHTPRANRRLFFGRWRRPRVLP